MLIVVALVIALVIKTFVVQAFFIPSSSMENTLDIGDKVLVNKLVYHFRSIQPGDIIVFNGDGSWEPPSAAQPSDPIVRLGQRVRATPWSACSARRRADGLHQARDRGARRPRRLLQRHRAT